MITTILMMNTGDHVMSKVEMKSYGSSNTPYRLRRDLICARRALNSTRYSSHLQTR